MSETHQRHCFNNLCTDVVGVLLSYLPFGGKVHLRRTSHLWKQTVDEYCASIWDIDNGCTAAGVLSATDGSDLYKQVHLPAELHHLLMAADLVDYWWSTQGFTTFNMMTDDSEPINGKVSDWGDQVLNYVEYLNDVHCTTIVTIPMPKELNWLLEHYHTSSPRDKYTPLMNFVGRALTSNPILKDCTPSHCLLPRRGFVSPSTQRRSAYR